MIGRLRMLLLGIVAVFALWAPAAPAHAWTCAVSDPDVEEVVCPVVTQAGALLCKVKICFL